MSRPLRRIEERIGSPGVVDVVDAEGGVLEEVGGLVIDLERVFVVELVDVETARSSARVYYKRIRPTPTPPIKSERTTAM